jgi:hypothetical protein
MAAPASIAEATPPSEAEVAYARVVIGEIIRHLEQAARRAPRARMDLASPAQVKRLRTLSRLVTLALAAYELPGGPLAKPQRAPGKRRYTPDQIRTIMQRLANGEACSAIARDYGCVQGMIYLIGHGKVYRDVTCTLETPPPLRPVTLRRRPR